MIKEEWEQPELSSASVLSYLLETRAKLSEIAEIAKENDQVSKVKQKTYFDKKARDKLKSHDFTSNGVKQIICTVEISFRCD